MEYPEHAARCLDNGLVLPKGGNEAKKVDVRLVCATNIPLAKLVEERRVREDLGYRIAQCQVQVPPLRERSEEIDAIALQYVTTLGHAGLRVSDDALDALHEYPWPGNVRELQNVLGTASVEAAGTGEIERAHLAVWRRPGAPEASSLADNPSRSQKERMDQERIGADQARGQGRGGAPASLHPNTLAKYPNRPNADREPRR